MQTEKIDRQTGRINSLTGARFTAIMIIVFSHFEFLTKYGTFGNIYWNYFHNANMGVDFFFFLSGFGMMLSSIKKDPTGTVPIGGIKGLIRFGKAHVQKIYPVYIAFLIFGIPKYLIYCILDNQTLYKLIIECALYFSFDLTLLQSATGMSKFSHSLNGVCWFLSSLFCIYLVSPIIMQLLKKKVKTIRTAIIGVTISIGISLVLAIMFTWLDQHTLFDDLCYGSPYRRVFYVILGMLVAQIYTFINQDPQRYMVKCFTNGAFEYIFIGSSMIWFFLRNMIAKLIGPYVYIVDMIIVCGDLFALAIGKGVVSQFFSSKIMVYLGTISMYIFLSHYNIRWYIDSVVKLLKIESLPTGILEVIVILILTFMVSKYIHQFRTQKKNTSVKQFMRRKY